LFGLGIIDQRGKGVYKVRFIDYINLIISIAGGGLGLLAWIKTVTARHSFNLYVVSGVILVAGAVIRYLTTGNLLSSGTELFIGVILLIYIFSSGGSIRIR
jgi:hypothetical protein